MAVRGLVVSTNDVAAVFRNEDLFDEELLAPGFDS